MMNAIPATVAHVRRLPGGLFLCVEVADALGVSPATVRRLGERDHDGLGPTHETCFGRMRLLLYDGDAVQRLHDHLGQHRAACGQPRLWNEGERRSRRAAHSAAGYRRRRAAQLRARGDEDGAARVGAHAHRLVTALRAEHAARVQLTRRCDVTAPEQ